MADRLDRKLDPRPIAPSFDHFPSLNAPAPAPLALTHRRQRFGPIRPMWRAPVPFLSEPKLKHFKNRRPGAMDAGVARLKCIGMMENDVLDYYWMISIRG